VVISLERGADLHMAQRMPLPLTVSCFSKIQIGFTFLVPAHRGSPGQRAVCVCVCVCKSRAAAGGTYDEQVVSFPLASIAPLSTAPDQRAGSIDLQSQSRSLCSRERLQNHVRAPPGEQTDSRTATDFTFPLELQF